jgi:hypothetical protein
MWHFISTLAFGFCLGLALNYMNRKDKNFTSGR